MTRARRPPAAARRPVPGRRPRPLGHGRGAGAARRRRRGARRATRAPVPDEARARLEADGVAVARRRTPALDLLPGARTVVKSPGVPQEAPVVAGGRASAGCPWSASSRSPGGCWPNDFIAVTGSNGKTTTVELIGHIHREAGLPVAVAGNVGTALSSLAGTLDPAATIVCEASLVPARGHASSSRPRRRYCSTSPPDHLDRHGTLAAYTRAKLQVFARQAQRGRRGRAARPRHRGPRRLRAAGLLRRRPGAELADRAGHLWWDEQPLMRRREIRLRGDHNRHNAMAAAAVTLARGSTRGAVRAGAARPSRGVAHRLEEVADARRRPVRQRLEGHERRRGASPALRSFDGRVHVILGGRGHAGDLAPLVTAVARAGSRRLSDRRGRRRAAAPR